MMDVARDLMLPYAHCKHVMQDHAAHQILTWTVRAAIAAAGVLGRMHHSRAVGDTTAQGIAASTCNNCCTHVQAAACSLYFSPGGKVLP